MRVITPALAFFFFWLPLATFSFKDTPVALLRGEAGWYQNLAHAPPAEQQNLEHTFITTSLKGHYLPIGFWADFQYTKWAGMREPVIRARQIVTVALLAAAIFSLVLLLGRIWELPIATRTGTAFGLAAIYLFQPRLIELVSWPIMILQLAWLIFTVLTLFALIKLVTSNSKIRWAWLTALFAYASMHAFGLGLATVLAAGTLLLIIWIASLHGKFSGSPGATRHIGFVLLTLILFSTAHAFVMARPGLDVTPPPMLHGTGLGPVLGLIAFYPFLLVSSLFVRLPLTLSVVETLGNIWLPGAIVVVAAIAGIFLLWRRALERNAPIAWTRFILFGFSAVAFLGCILLIGVRQTREPGAQAFLEFLNSSSYLVTIGFTLLGTWLALILPAARRAPMIALPLFVCIGFGSMVAQQYYERTVFRKVVPSAAISHTDAWRAIVAMARESYAAQLPIPNVPMYPLAQFGDWTLVKYEYMLHDELGLKPDERCQFVAWEKCRGDDWPRYENAAPSLRKVISILHLDAPE